MKAYKGFNKDMTCRGFQYEEGKEYTTDEAELCKSGFHACESPIDCLRYYPPATSEYHEVEIEDVTDERDSDDTKICGKKIKIGAKLSIAKLCELHFEFVKSHTINSEKGGNYSSLSGGDRSSLSGGNCSSLSGGNCSSLSGGNCSSLSGGDYSSLSSGDYSSLSGGDYSSLSGGNYSNLSGDDYSSLSGGNCSSLSGGDRSSLSGGDRSSLSGGDYSSLSSGDYSSLSGGDYSSLSGGDYSSLSGGDRSSLSGGNCSSLSGGDYSSLSGRGTAIGGKDSIIVVRGNNIKAKGGIGSVIVIVNEKKDNHNIAEWKAGVIDGEMLKADTWYALKGGEFIEVIE